MPRRVIGFGQKKFLAAAGSTTYDANQVVIEWENGAAFWVQNSWVCPDKNARTSQQGMMLQGAKGEYQADHADRHCTFVTDEPGFQQYNPDFVKPFDDWDEATQVDSHGHGIESNALGIKDVQRLALACYGAKKGKPAPQPSADFSGIIPRATKKPASH